MVSSFVRSVRPLVGLCLVIALALAGAVTAAAVEILTPKRLNDNLTIPLVSGGVMTLFMGV